MSKPNDDDRFRDDVMFDNSAAETAFLRQFAAQIGVALREREDATPQQQGRQTSKCTQESVQELYRSLVFDEPIIDNIDNVPVVASALARQLLDEKSDYALSNRLVNGVVYLCQKATTTKEGATTTQQQAQSYSTSAIAMAKLAFACLVEMPLQCCTVNGNMKALQKLLGSYKGTPKSVIVQKSEEENNNDDARIEQLIAASQPPQQESPVDKETSSCSDEAAPVAQQQQSPDEEVWAAESDCSDYDFTEGLGEQRIDPGMAFFQQQFPGTDDDWLDPKALSRPDSQLTQQQAQDALQSLLQAASYTLLQPIFFQSDSEVSSITMTLTQLVLTLLEPGNNDTNKMDLQSISDEALLAPLWIVRDAASYHATTNKKKAMDHNESKATASRKQSKLASGYLHILQTLLEVDQAHLQDLQRQSATTKDKDLCVASVVGLSALSVWCTMTNDESFSSEILEMTIETLVDCMNDLAHVLERVSASDSYQERVLGSVVPFLEILSGIYYDHYDEKNVAISGRSGTAVAQTLLNSGFLRQALSLVIVGNDETTAPPLYHPIYHALWGVCIAYPKIVGKYIFRYPGTNDLIRRFTISPRRQKDEMTKATDEARDCVQCILWNVFGWMQCQDASSGAGRLVLKSKGNAAASPPLTQDECKEVGAKVWTQLCLLVTEGLKSSFSDGEIGERSVQEWHRLLSFARMPSVSSTMKELLDASCLERITTAFNNLPKEEIVAGKPKKTKTDDGEADEESKIHDDPKETNKPSKQQHIVAQTRKILKEYKLYFQGTVAIGSSKTD